MIVDDAVALAEAGVLRHRARVRARCGRAHGHRRGPGARRSASARAVTATARCSCTTTSSASRTGFGRSSCAATPTSMPTRRSAIARFADDVRAGTLPRELRDLPRGRRGERGPRPLRLIGARACVSRRSLRVTRRRRMRDAGRAGRRARSRSPSAPIGARDGLDAVGEHGRRRSSARVGATSQRPASRARSRVSREVHVAVGTTGASASRSPTRSTNGSPGLRGNDRPRALRRHALRVPRPDRLRVHDVGRHRPPRHRLLRAPTARGTRAAR